MYFELLFFSLFQWQITSNEFSAFTSVEGKSAKSNRRQNLPDGYVPFPQFGVAYRIYEIRSTWREAGIHCFVESAQLAIIDNWSKVEQVNQLRTSRSELQWLHVGIYWSPLASRWVRADTGEPLRHLPWAVGEPDGSGHCVGIDSDERVGDDEGLVDYDCDDHIEFFVCEIPLKT